MRFLYCFFLLVFFACTSEYPGYKKIDKDMYFQLHQIGEDSIIVNTNDYVTCDLVYKNMEDSVFFQGRRKFQVAADPPDNSFDKAITRLHENDSASFILPTQTFFESTLETSVPSYLANDDKIMISLNIIEVQSQEKYEREKEAFLHWIEDFGGYEKVILRQFIEQKELDVKPTESGLYYLVLKKGHGRKVRKDDTLTIHYEGRFLNGKFFDSTKKRNEAFSFVYGQEWQVIEGLEKAIGMMQEGEKALFILPSDLAWGKTGSSTGIIPPYTSLIFEVEVLAIN
ncbi:MAG: hypothetical protein GVY19_11685 [Bacteroidetes bacterium]|jgi:FKBP-type peptidyl-prolyl cis-trans isomerase|nr:hypothetical protein [Bacteroidota bacterium]